MWIFLCPGVVIFWSFLKGEMLGKPSLELRCAPTQLNSQFYTGTQLKFRSRNSCGFGGPVVSCKALAGFGQFKIHTFQLKSTFDDLWARILQAGYWLRTNKRIDFAEERAQRATKQSL